MERRTNPTSPADRRILAVLRVPAHELACSLPGEFEPVTVGGQGLVLLDYAQRASVRLLGLARAALHHLAVRVPVRSSTGNGRHALWVPRRFVSSRLGTTIFARCGSAAPAERAQFSLSLEGFHVELEVRSERGRVLYLRAETSGPMGASLFRRPEDIEALLCDWSRGYRAASLCGALDRTAVPTESAALQPMLVHALQSSTLPELFPGIEEAVELDCVLRQVTQRPITSRVTGHRYLEHLKLRRDLDAPPAGAFSSSS